MRTFRCSSLPLFMRCAAAAQRPDIMVHSTNAAAEVGTDTHDHLRCGVEGGRVQFDAIRNPETRGLVAIGLRLWRDHLRDLFPSPVCERELSVEVAPGITVTGHTDVQSGMVGTCRVLDWKSGRLDSDYREQLFGYAALEMLENHAVERVETHIAWLRDNEIENYTMTRDELPEWVARVKRLRAWNGVYDTGSHCGYCPRSHECPGYNAIVRSEAAAVLDLDVEQLEERMAAMPPAQVLELVRRAKLVENVAKSVRSAARNLVDQGGDIETDDAKLTIQTQRKRSVDVFAAWPVLQDVLDDRELALCCDVRLSKVEECVAKKAPPRKGAAAKRELAERLNEVDAIRTTEIKKLTERRK